MLRQLTRSWTGESVCNLKPWGKPFERDYSDAECKCCGEGNGDAKG